MKRALLLLAALAVTGCVFEAPLVEHPSITMDPSLLGVWNLTEEDGSHYRMLVLKSTEQEYFIEYPVNDSNGMFFAAAMVETGATPLVQLKWLGQSDGENMSTPKPYHYATYTLAGNELAVRMVNEKTIGDTATTSHDLAAALESHRGDTNLFREIGRFRRAE